VAQEAEYLPNKLWVPEFKPQYQQKKIILTFFFIYWDYHVIFVLYAVYVLYYVYWFVYVEETLHPWNKTSLIMMCDLFKVLLNPIISILIIFASVSTKEIGL
jgi:hypothetical protein